MFSLKFQNWYQIFNFVYITFSKHKNTNLQIQLRLSSVNFEGDDEAYDYYKLWIFPWGTMDKPVCFLLKEKELIKRRIY